MVCKKSEKATVTYKFNADTERIYTTEDTPIKISTREGVLEDFTGGQCPIWYCFMYRDGFGNTHNLDPNSYTSDRGILGAVSNVQLVLTSSGFTPPFDRAWFMYATTSSNDNNPADDMEFVLGKTYRFRVNYEQYGRPILYGIKPYNPSGNIPPPLDNCGDPQPYCEILISDSSEEVIFSDRGKCPVTYSVSCGDCPEGTFKCNAPGYPGYCCLPCKEIAGEIKAITSQVRKINNV